MEGGFVNVRAFYREVRAPRGGASAGGGVRTGGVRDGAGDYGRRHPGASLGSRPVAGDAALQDHPPVSQAFLSLGSNLGDESALGRERKGEKAPRTVDIDVLLFGEEIIVEPGLEIPHQGVTRAFNLKGLADLDPNLDIPGRGRVGDLLDEADLSGIEELGEVGAL